MLAPGDSIHSRRALSWLLARGCSVLFVDGQDPETEGNVRHVAYPRVRDSERWLYRRFGWSRSLRLEKWAVGVRLRWLHHRFRSDVVHVHYADQRAYQCFEAGLRPLVLSVWGSDVNDLFRPDADPRDRRRAGEALAGADRVLADAPDMVEKCSALAGRPVRVELLPYGIDTKRFASQRAEAGKSWREKLGVPDGARVLLSMRGLERRYGHHLILEAFHGALGLCRAACVLVFKKFKEGGAYDAAYEAELRARAEALGVAPLVRWAGHVPYDQLPEVYASANALVNYPETDAFPVMFLEAAASGTPVITTALPSYKGTFAEQCFRLVEPGRVDRLAEAIAAFVNEPAAARADALVVARRAVERDFDEAVTAERLLGIYRGLRHPRPAHDSWPCGSGPGPFQAARA
jgi:glycosyltransferase involved in cell wall biosynthesis